jgi:3-oxoacyl-[acyl-carrier-protein] synthase-1
VSDIFVLATGAFTAAGGDTASVMGACLTGFQLFEDFDLAGPDGESLGGAVTPLVPSLNDLDRLSALGFLALGECAANILGPPAPLIVIAPAAADLGGDPERLLDAMVGSDAVLQIDPKTSAIIPKGRNGIAEALRLAYRHLASGATSECYLLGVDSLVTGRRLKRLVRQGALIHEGNPDGIIPGEAAAALRLSLRPQAGALAVIAGFGSAAERAGNADRDAVGAGPLTGLGFSLSSERALSEARQASTIDSLTAIVPDRAGPQNRLEELALARLRPPLATISPQSVYLPALSAGETGAASGVLGLATLAFFIHKKVIEGPGVCLFSGDDEWRGAAVVAPAEPKHNRKRNV